MCATRGVVDGLLIRPGDVECTIVPTAVVGGAGGDAGGRTTTINVTRPTGLRITVGLGVAVDTPRVALDAILLALLHVGMVGVALHRIDAAVLRPGPEATVRQTLMSVLETPTTANKCVSIPMEVIAVRATLATH